jgi:hypothetical protein
MRLMNPTDVCVGPDALLEKTLDPRHRAIIKNYRRHVLLEISGRWEDVINAEMMVAEPRYRIDFGGQNVTVNGYDEIADMYKAAIASGATTFAPLEERIAVADWGIAIESYLAAHQRGRDLQAMGVEVPNPDGFYQLEHWVGAFWPYDENCRLIGEHVFEDAGSRAVHEISEADFITPSRAAAMLAPLIARVEEEG